MKTTEIIWGCGHGNIRSTHKTTFEVTKEATLTKHGDCIIAVKATKGAADMSPEFKEAIKRESAHLIVTIEADGLKELVRAHGSTRLTLTDPTEIVIRKSDYVCSRTVAVGASKAAGDISRELVKRLRSPQKVKITLTVESH